jgi:hypothetical protein
MFWLALFPLYISLLRFKKSLYAGWCTSNISVVFQEVPTSDLGDITL